MSHTWPGGFHEANTGYYAAVGYLCHQWNNVEQFVYSLATQMMDVPFQMRNILFRHMGVPSTMIFIEDYSSTNHEPTVFEQLKHVCKYVDRCRVNRNLIIHGFPTNDPETGAKIIESRPDKNRKIAKSVPISIEAVRRVCMECERAGWLLIRGQFIVAPPEQQSKLRTSSLWEQIEPTLFLKPPLPELLAVIPHGPQTPPPQA